MRPLIRLTVSVSDSGEVEVDFDLTVMCCDPDDADCDQA